MEERSLRVLRADTTFFSKISTTISKLLVPTKVGLNGMLISMKRNNVIKAYEAVKNSNEIIDSVKKEAINKKYEEGKIIGTSPKIGKTVKKGTTVTLIVSFKTFSSSINILFISLTNFLTSFRLGPVCEHTRLRPEKNLLQVTVQTQAN